MRIITEVDDVVCSAEDAIALVLIVVPDVEETDIESHTIVNLFLF